MIPIWNIISVGILKYFTWLLSTLPSLWNPVRTGLSRGDLQWHVACVELRKSFVFAYTDFCKQLSKKEALGQVSSESELDDHHSSGSDTERPFHHPFQIKERPASIVMNIRVSGKGDTPIASCLWWLLLSRSSG